MQTWNLNRTRLLGLGLFVLLILGTCLVGRTCSVEIIGHRGASHSAPENTLASVNLAWKRDADAVEIDVWMTKDRRIVALHDSTTERTTGKDWNVAERTLAEIEELDAGSWKDRKWAGQRIPTLEAVLATVPDGKRLFIEIKCGEELLPELERVLKAAGLDPGQTVVISFDLGVVKAVKAKMPQCPVYWIHDTSPKLDEKTGRLLDPPDELIEKCRRAGLDGLDLAHDSQLTKPLVDKIHGLGMELYVWTVNSPEDAARLAALGVDGITTDRPGWLRRWLQVVNQHNRKSTPSQ